jgi:hypothetical protein
MDDPRPRLEGRMLVEDRRHSSFVAEEDEGKLRVPNERYRSPRNYDLRTMVTAHGVERQRPRFHHGFQVAFLISSPPPLRRNPNGSCIPQAAAVERGKYPQRIV